MLICFRNIFTFSLQYSFLLEIKSQGQNIVTLVRQEAHNKPYIMAKFKMEKILCCSKLSTKVMYLALRITQARNSG